MLKNSLQNQESPLVSGPRGAKDTKGEGFRLHFFSDSGWTFICRYGPLGAKKKQGSGRSPEILVVHWPFGFKYKAYKPSC